MEEKGSQTETGWERKKEKNEEGKIVKEIAQKGHLRKYHHLQDDNILKVLLNDRW